MTLRSMIIALIVSAIVIFGGYKIYSLFHRPLTHKLNSDMQLIGLITNENAHDINLHSILNGEVGLLIVDHAYLLYQQIAQKIPQAKYLNVEEVFNVNNLHLFDKNADGILSPDDPIFPHLFVIHFYNNGQQHDIKSLAAASIKGFLVNNMTPTGNHQVLMVDGTERTLYGIHKIEKPERKD